MEIFFVLFVTLLKCKNVIKAILSSVICIIYWGHNLIIFFEYEIFKMNDQVFMKTSVYHIQQTDHASLFIPAGPIKWFFTTLMVTPFTLLMKYEKVKYDSILTNRIAYQLDVFNF